MILKNFLFLSTDYDKTDLLTVNKSKHSLILININKVQRLELCKLILNFEKVRSKIFEKALFTINLGNISFHLLTYYFFIDLYVKYVITYP